MTKEELILKEFEIKSIKDKQTKIDNLLSVLKMLDSKFDVRIDLNKYHYNGIKDDYILMIKMKDDSAFICCGLSKNEAFLFKEGFYGKGFN